MKKHNFAEVKTPPNCCDCVKKPCTVGQVIEFKGKKQENIQNKRQEGKKRTGDFGYTLYITKPIALRITARGKEKHRNRKLLSCLPQRWQQAGYCGLTEYIN